MTDRPQGGRGPAYLGLAGAILSLARMLAYTASVRVSRFEVCCPPRVVDTEWKLWLGATLVVVALYVASAVALFRGRLRLGGGLLLAAAAVALFAPARILGAVVFGSAGAWALVQARRAEEPIGAGEP